MGINMPRADRASPFDRILGAVKGVAETKGAIQKIAGTDPETQKLEHEQKQRAEVEDPASPLMASIRQYSAAKGIKVPDNVNYLQFEKSPLKLAIDQRIKSDEELRQIGAKQQADKKVDLDPAQRLAKAPADVRGKVGLIANALQNMTDYEKAFSEGATPSHINANTPLVGRFMTDDAITIAQRQMNETIGRLNSGGVIGKEEVPTFQAMGPRPGDSPEVMAKKLADFREAMAVRLSAFGFQPEELAQVKGFDAGKMGYSPESKQRRSSLLSSHTASQNAKAGGGAPNAQAGGITPDVIAYAEKHGITLQEAAAVKAARGGK